MQQLENDTVKNCIIKNFGRGIHLEGCSNIVLASNEISSNYYGINFHAVSNSEITNNIINNNEVGIRLGSLPKANLLVENNIVCNNKGLDFYIQNATGYTGKENMCNTTENFNDEGTTGCTYTCNQINQTQNPDLTITNISLTPEQPVSGGEINVTITAKNVGGGNPYDFWISERPKEINLNLYIDDRIFYFLVCPSPNCRGSFEPGKTATLNTNINTAFYKDLCSVGTHTLEVKIDPYNDVNESDEKNNEFGINFTVQEKLLSGVPDDTICKNHWPAHEGEIINDNGGASCPPKSEVMGCS